MDTETVKCFFCGGKADIKVQGDLKVVTCQQCKRETELDEYQDMFEVWLGDIRKETEK
jgi:hypothetical protein